MSEVNFLGLAGCNVLSLTEDRVIEYLRLCRQAGRQAGSGCSPIPLQAWCSQLLS